MSGCIRCDPGTYSTDVGATSQGVCRACQAGTWSRLAGSNSNATCQPCSPGSWSSTTGASRQNSCQKCPKGTWSAASGASTSSACHPCGPGLYQPALGQASLSNCIECEPGSYNHGHGAARCTRCPKGTWGGARGATSCNVCPDGFWTYIKGSLHADDCTRCNRANNCNPGATARVTVEIEGLGFAALAESQRQALKSAFAAQIAATCNLPSNESVWDLLGGNGTTTITDGMVEAFLAVPQGSYANVLARALYAPAFREQMMQITDTVPGVAQASAIGAVVLKLEKFERQVITATATTTTSTVTTVTSTETTAQSVETTPTRAHDLRGTTTGSWKYESHANRGLSLLWCQILLASAMAAYVVN